MRLALTFLFALCAAQALGADAAYFSAQTASPSAIAVSGEFIIVLDASSGALLGGNPRAGLSALDVPGRARGAGGDEKGQTTVVTGDATSGYRCQLLMGGRKLRSFELKPTAPIASITDVATKNEILWVLQQTPPLVALFGADGAELARSDLSSVAHAPFSLALGPSGEGYVTDPIGPAVVELNAFGQYKAVHKLAGTGYTRPTAIAVDLGGRVWIGDTVLNEVAAFSAQGKTLERIASMTPTAVEDPIRLAASADSLWALAGWSARLAKIPNK